MFTATAEGVSPASTKLLNVAIRRAGAGLDHVNRIVSAVSERCWWRHPAPPGPDCPEQDVTHWLLGSRADSETSRQHRAAADVFDPGRVDWRVVRPT